MNLINQIVDQIVRPPREDYFQALLGPPTLALSNASQSPLSRQHFALPNIYHQSLAVSLFTFHPPSSQYIVYLHGSSSCRLQALHYLPDIIRAGYNLCAFDFAGSGISEGEYTTAGYRQAEDIRIVVRWLVERGAEEIVLWGRSMGAVAALIYASRGHPLISGLVLDSPYFALSQLITQKASEVTQIPSALMTPLLLCVDSSLQQAVNVSLEDLNTTAYLSSERLAHLPVLVVTSQNDTIVGCHHSQQLLREYPCSKKGILYIEQGHNKPRCRDTAEKILQTVREWTGRGKASLAALVGTTSRSNSYKFSLAGNTARSS